MKKLGKLSFKDLQGHRPMEAQEMRDVRGGLAPTGGEVQGTPGPGATKYECTCYVIDGSWTGYYVDDKQAEERIKQYCGEYDGICTKA